MEAPAKTAGGRAVIQKAKRNCSRTEQTAPAACIDWCTAGQSAHSVHSAVKAEKREVRKRSVQAVKEITQLLPGVLRAFVDALEPANENRTG